MRLKSIIFLLIFINNYAQTSTEKKEVFPIFPICELLPESKLADCFSETMQEHIDDNFFYPKQAWDLDLQAIVRVNFDINENEFANIKFVDPNITFQSLMISRTRIMVF